MFTPLEFNKIFVCPPISPCSNKEFEPYRLTSYPLIFEVPVEGKLILLRLARPVSPFNVILPPIVTVLLDLVNVNPPVAF